MEQFYSSTTVPFIKALIVEMKGAFSLDNLPVLKAMTCLNPDKIPKENEKFLDYGKNDISKLYDFHGKQRDDVFEGRRVTSLPILTCTADSLAAEYNGYIAYVARQRIKQYEILKKRKEISKLGYYKPAQIDKKKRDVKVIEAELSEITKMCSLVAVEYLLDYTFLSTAFPTICTMLKVYAIIPFSEAVVKRCFSKMNVIMTKKRCLTKIQSIGMR